MKPKTKRVKLPGVPAWGIRNKEGLCFWALPKRRNLDGFSLALPRIKCVSSEAKAVRVRIVPVDELRRLVEAAGGK